MKEKAEKVAHEVGERIRGNSEGLSTREIRGG